MKRATMKELKRALIQPMPKRLLVVRNVDPFHGGDDFVAWNGDQMEWVALPRGEHETVYVIDEAATQQLRDAKAKDLDNA